MSVQIELMRALSISASEAAVKTSCSTGYKPDDSPEDDAVEFGWEAGDAESNEGTSKSI